MWDWKIQCEVTNHIKEKTFQAKTELGIDLGEILATQACAELAYEIDTEIVKLLTDNAKVHADLTWSKTLPIGVNKRD